MASTRKFIHVGVGMWSVGTVLLFTDHRFAAIPPLSFIVLSYISYKLELFPSVETGEKGNLGTIYFPLAFVLLIAMHWERPGLLVASLMPMTWGDAVAALVGTWRGRHRFQVFRQMRSWEGSAAMFLVSSIAVSTALWLFGVESWPLCVAHGALVGFVSAVVEALTPWHLTVSLMAGALLWVLLA